MASGGHAGIAAGAVCIAVGALSLSCVLCCYRRFIPFMVMVVQTVSQVIVQNPMMVCVSLFGSISSCLWVAMCIVASVGAGVHYHGQVEGRSKDTSYVVYFAVCLVFLWGTQVFYNLCHVTYCGVFGRWYHGYDDGAPLRKSFSVACTTSFGSICLGSFLIAAVRALEATIRAARRDAQQDGNAVCCVVLLLLECVVSCLGDILAYFSEWAYVQCAVRGVNFIQAARITYTMMTCANAYFILQDLLIDSVVNLGALLCGLVGAGFGALTGWGLTGLAPPIAAGAAVGFVCGLAAGGSTACILSSGTKTILVLWAEDPQPLMRTRPQIHEEFEYRIRSKLTE